MPKSIFGAKNKFFILINLVAFGCSYLADFFLPSNFLLNKNIIMVILYIAIVAFPIYLRRSDLLKIFSQLTYKKD